MLDFVYKFNLLGWNTTSIICVFSFESDFLQIAKRERERKQEKIMAEEGVVIGCHTIDEYKQHMKQAKEAKKLVIIC